MGTHLWSLKSNLQIIPVHPILYTHTPPPPHLTMANSDNQQSPFEQYLMPLAVCVPVCVAAFMFMKSSMTDSALPPLVIEKSANDVKKAKKKKKAATKAKTTEVESEEEAELIEEAEVEEEKPAAKTKKTGAQKRKEKKEREQADAKTEAKAVKKAKVVNVVQTSVVRVVKAAVIEDEWVTAEPVKKGKAVAQKVTEPTAVEAEVKAVVSAKEKKKAAKDRAEQQRANAKKNDHLKNLPEEVLAQMAKFNQMEAPTAAVVADDWTDIAVKPAYVPKSQKVAAVVVDADAPEAAPVYRRADKEIFYKDASQAEIFTIKGDRAGNDELSKYSFKGLEASW